MSLYTRHNLHLVMKFLLSLPPENYIKQTIIGKILKNNRKISYLF